MRINNLKINSFGKLEDKYSNKILKKIDKLRTINLYIKL